jgi:hypothetical protein
MSDQTSSRPAPALTEELRAQARKAPGNWLYSIDQAYDPDDGVPPYAIVGAWPVDEHGKPGEFAHNPNYLPSPMSLGLPEPTDLVDAAMQMAATGHQPQGVVIEALESATLYLVPTEDGGLTAYEDEEGSFVPLLTDTWHAPATAPRLRQVGWPELLDVLPDDMAVKINPGSPVSVRIMGADLRAVPEPGGAVPAPGPAAAPHAAPEFGFPGIPYKGNAAS